MNSVKTIESSYNRYLFEDISPREAYVKNKWNMGIRANGNPVNIITKVYSTMFKLLFEWKTFKPFSIIARKKSLNGLYCYVGVDIFKRHDEEIIVDLHMLPHLHKSKIIEKTSYDMELESKMYLYK